ncbi:MAG: DNA polymerase III subunit delta' [Candidatus Omnitrophica bacterium]|nr:DNA polymerase III subunit delta' [Candidatus Omnitrophota bacterium]
MAFRDIKGQEKIIEVLRNYMRASRLANTFLFVGPEGVGKKLVAQTFAKALNCAGQQQDDSCDQCGSCRKIDANQHADVSILGSDDEEIKIEQVRQLQASINLRPYEARKKIFIIDNAHNLNPESSNAFLKTLEEPPQDSVIILLTAKPKMLFKTVISRCQVLRFSGLARDVLDRILINEYAVERTQAHFLAYFCEGSLGKALRLKEAGFLKNDRRGLEELLRPSCWNIGKSTEQNRQFLKTRLNMLAGWFRDMYMVKIGLAHDGLIHAQEQEELLRMMKRYSFSELDGIFNTICETLFNLERNINVKLLIANLQATIWKN